MCYVSNKLLLSVGIHQAFNSVGSQIKVTEQSKESLKKTIKDGEISLTGGGVQPHSLSFFCLMKNLNNIFLNYIQRIFKCFPL